MTELRFDADRNLLELGGQRLVFHCHHYNVFLQRSIEEMLGEEAVQIQVDAAAESTRRILEGLFAASKGGWDERLRIASEVFSSNGFGHADLSGVVPGESAIVRLPTSHYAVGWRAKFGPAKAPVCHFATGFWRGALVAVAGYAPERVMAHELHCHAVDGKPCELHLEVR